MIAPGCFERRTFFHRVRNASHRTILPLDLVALYPTPESVCNAARDNT